MKTIFFFALLVFACCEKSVYDMTDEELQEILGTGLFMPSNSNLPSATYRHPSDLDVPIPPEFDGRKKWGYCVHPPRNQKACGSW